MKRNDVRTIIEMYSMGGLETSEAVDEIMYLAAVEYKHSLSPVMVRGLFKLYRVGGCSKLLDVDLSKSEFTNFQKLRYFGLAVKQENHEWIVTDKGVEFLEGIRSCEKFVYTRGGKVLRSDEKTIFLNEVKKIGDILEFYREQARSKMNQPTLFER